MTITLTCPSCGKEWRFNDDMGGKQGTCSCGAVIDIPVASAPSPFQNISAEPPMGQPPAAQMPPMGQPPAAQMPPMGQPPAPQMPPVVQPPAPQMPPMGQPPAPQMPPMGQPAAPQMPPMGQPAAPQMPPMGQPPMGQPPMGQPPMGQPPMGQPPGVAGNPFTPNVQMSSGGFSTLNFIGHQLFFWAQIGLITGAALILINSIMLFAGEGEGTLNDVGIYIAGGASIPCLVGLGFWIGFPKQAQCFGLILTTFITTTAGILLLSIAFLGEVRGIVLPIIGFLAYFTAGVFLYLSIMKICKNYSRQDVNTLATAGFALNIVAGVVYTFVIIALSNGWFPNSFGGAQAVFGVYFLLMSGVLAGISAVNMLTFQRLKRTFQNR
jgi:hypothetical protein